MHFALRRFKQVDNAIGLANADDWRLAVRVCGLAELATDPNVRATIDAQFRGGIAAQKCRNEAGWHVRYVLRDSL